MWLGGAGQGGGAGGSAEIKCLHPTCFLFRETPGSTPHQHSSPMTRLATRPFAWIWGTELTWGRAGDTKYGQCRNGTAIEEVDLCASIPFRVSLTLSSAPGFLSVSGIPGFMLPIQHGSWVMSLRHLKRAGSAHLGGCSAPAASGQCLLPPPVLPRALAGLAAPGRRLTNTCPSSVVAPHPSW